MGMSGDDDRFRRDEEVLRRALREEADGVLPSLDALSRIRRRTARPPLWRRPVVLGMAAASVTAVGVIAASAYVLGGSPDDTTATGPDSSPSPSLVQSPRPSPTDTGTPDPDQTVSAPPETDEPQPENETVPVYYFTDTPRGQRLVREFRTVPAPDGPLVAAVQTMLAERALDPEYETYWQADTEVRSVEVRDDVIEVDFTGETDYTGVRDEIAQLAVQQLVYTVTAAAADAEQDGGLPVRILVDGEPPGAMWGRLDLSDPIARAPQLEILSPVQIHTPQDGDVVDGSVRVEGVAIAFEAHLDWRVFDDEGNIVEEGFTTTTDSSTLAPFSFEVDLDPGIYSIVVIESDPSGGAEGPGPTSDTKNFTVE
jgi:Immunoglobulin-like domain of bacterial spore germination/Sporulation and spore germination